MIQVRIDGLKQTQDYLTALANGELKFGIVKGLTSLAGASREQIIDELPGRFTLRTRWWQRGPYAIKTDKATKQSMTSRVYTDAPWMNLQETGGIKTSAGKRVAIPMPDVRRTKRDLVQKSQKPRALAKAFHIKTKTGNDFLAVRIGRGRKSQLRFMWLLERSATIRARFGFVDTANRVVDQVGLLHISEGIKYALETSKR